MSSSAETPWKLNEAQGIFKHNCLPTVIGERLDGGDWKDARCSQAKLSSVIH